MSSPRAALFLTVLMVSSLYSMGFSAQEESAADSSHWEELRLDPTTLHSATPVATTDGAEGVRPSNAQTHLGTWDASGLLGSHDLPAALAAIRPDLGLVIVDGGVGLWDAREQLNHIPGLAVRDHIAPSGFLVQGDANSLGLAASQPAVLAIHPLPLGFMVDADLASLTEVDLPGTQVLVHATGWREAQTGVRLDAVHLSSMVSGDLDAHSKMWMSAGRQVDHGLFTGRLAPSHIAAMAASPALAFLAPAPVFELHNDRAYQHQNVDDVVNYFPSQLNGSAQRVAVADSGIDQDHGDFNGRIHHVESVTWGDSSTEDMHSGHGTHVACTVLGNGSRGGYAGIAPQADLHFQAMEDDSSGQFSGASMDYMLRTAYEDDAHIHTNSWGAQSSFGEYTTSSEDVDSRTSTYDQFWSYDGMLVLVSAGNDGPNSDTVTPPATAKNAIAVANHHNRGGGAPDTIATGSSRGPTDDGRIKPDLAAPGSWVRSCRSQDASDTGGASWSSTWYLEYSGTSMAAPNAAGAAALVREYLTEVAGRPSPQGALIKGMLILGAQDMGARDIPNMDEGWGRVDLASTLLPGSVSGVWVDDRNMVRSGQTKTYEFNLSQGNVPFKTVLTWSDYPGSSWANTQLKNDLDLKVTAPDGTVYLGNDFANGRSTTGGVADRLNNVEVTLIDQAMAGVWTVEIHDYSHGGARSQQPFALAVRGAGVNDLRSDPLPVAASFEMSSEIPQVNDPIDIRIQVQNQGGGIARSLPIEAYAGGQFLGEQVIDLGPGMMRWVEWTWTPTSEGDQAVTVRIDPRDEFEEIDEDNNLFQTLVGVSAPGVRVDTENAWQILDDAAASSTPWAFSVRNTALLPTNATIVASTPVNLATGASMNHWLTSFNRTNFELDGSEAADVSFTLVHESPPAPGLYQLVVTATDEDNDIDFPLTLTFEVPVLPEVGFQMPFVTLPVSPVLPTSFAIDVVNQGNGLQGYDLRLEPPLGWRMGLDSLGTTTGAATGSTGAIPQTGTRTVDITIEPPQGMPQAGLALNAELRVTSQVDPSRYWTHQIPMEVATYEAGELILESNYGSLRPDSVLSIQFTVANLGNVDLELTPDLTDRPGGWSITNGASGLTVPAGDSGAYMVGLSGNGGAQAGAFNIRLVTPTGEAIVWNGYLDVVAPPAPTLDFWSLTHQDGTEAIGDASAAGEVMPGGTGVGLSWLLGNAGAEAWTPSVSLSPPDGDWTALCDEAGEIAPDGAVQVDCMLMVPEQTPAGFEAAVTFAMAVDGQTLTDVVMFRIAETPALSWRTVSVDELMDGNAGEVIVEVTNAGNSIISEKVEMGLPAGWTGSIETGSTVNLAPGEAARIRMSITPGAAEAGTLTMTLGDGAVAGDGHGVEMMALSNPEKAASFANTVAIIGLLLLALAGAALGGVLILRLKETPKPGAAMPAAAPAAFAAPAQTAAAPAAICWGCNVAINGARRACPGCGARYHSAGCSAASMTACRNCQAPASGFVDEAA